MTANISDNIRIILNELNISQQNFAESVGTTNIYISMIIGGKRKVISQRLALLIQEIYGYSAEWILHGKGEKRLCPFKSKDADKEMKACLKELAPEEIKCVYRYILFLEENENSKRAKRKLKKQAG
jgi:transcriptional regulator with XRE-family HTH domain